MRIRAADLKLCSVRRDIELLTDRVAAARARLAGLAAAELPARELDDMLGDGYAVALAGDAWVAQSQQRLDELLENAAVLARSRRDLHAHTRERLELQRSVAGLRRELAALRVDVDKLLTHR